MSCESGRINHKCMWHKNMHAKKQHILQWPVGDLCFFSLCYCALLFCSSMHSALKLQVPCGVKSAQVCGSEDFGWACQPSSRSSITEGHLEEWCPSAEPSDWKREVQNIHGKNNAACDATRLK